MRPGLTAPCGQLRPTPPHLQAVHLVLGPPACLARGAEANLQGEGARGQESGGARAGAALAAGTGDDPCAPVGAAARMAQEGLAQEGLAQVGLAQAPAVSHAMQGPETTPAPEPAPAGARTSFQRSRQAVGMRPSAGAISTHLVPFSPTSRRSAASSSAVHLPCGCRGPRWGSVRVVWFQRELGGGAQRRSQQVAPSPLPRQQAAARTSLVRPPCSRT